MLRRTYGDALSLVQVFRGHKAFKNGREDVEDEHRSDRPSTSKSDKNVSKMRSVLAFAAKMFQTNGFKVWFQGGHKIVSLI